MQYAVIMAGGAGTRLWPASRANRPKQLLRLFGGKSLLRESFERVAHVVPPESICVITGAVHLPLVAEALPEVPAKNLFGEPCGRDTANAIGLAAAILARRDPEATMGVFTADHVITPIGAFAEAVRSGYQAAEDHPDALVTFGIKPAGPHTGFGYVERGASLGDNVFAVERFAEKPDAATAARYVNDGRYYWNSGMFVWRVGTILEQLRAHLPGSHEGVTEIAQRWETSERAGVLERIYPGLQKISIDFAVMEKAPRVLVVEMNCRWADVGSWAALAEVLSADPQGNVKAAPRVLHLGSTGTIAVSEEPHLIATVGVANLVIVHTKDATLVCPKEQAQRLKVLVDELKEQFGDEYL